MRVEVSKCEKHLLQLTLKWLTQKVHILIIHIVRDVKQTRQKVNNG